MSIECRVAILSSKGEDAWTQFAHDRLAEIGVPCVSIEGFQTGIAASIESSAVLLLRMTGSFHLAEPPVLSDECSDALGSRYKNSASVPTAIYLSPQLTDESQRRSLTNGDDEITKHAESLPKTTAIDLAKLSASPGIYIADSTDALVDLGAELYWKKITADGDPSDEVTRGLTLKFFDSILENRKSRCDFPEDLREHRNEIKRLLNFKRAAFERTHAQMELRKKHKAAIDAFQKFAASDQGSSVLKLACANQEKIADDAEQLLGKYPTTEDIDSRASDDFKRWCRGHHNEDPVYAAKSTLARHLHQRSKLNKLRAYLGFLNDPIEAKLKAGVQAVERLRDRAKHGAIEPTSDELSSRKISAEEFLKTKRGIKHNLKEIEKAIAAAKDNLLALKTKLDLANNTEMKLLDLEHQAAKHVNQAKDLAIEDPYELFDQERLRVPIMERVLTRDRTPDRGMER